MTLQKATTTTTPRGLGGVLAATGVVMMSNTLLNAALPQLAKDRDAGQSQQAWMVDAYSLVFAALLIPAGGWGDRYGRRRALVAGLGVILAGNALAVLVPTAGAVVASRAACGVGAALAFPATLSTITSALPSEQRARGIARWAAVVGLAGFLGILVSGALVQVFAPSSVFVFGALAAACALVLVALFVPDSLAGGRSSLDLRGAVLALVAVGGVMLAVTEGPERGWSSALVIVGLTAGAGAMACFVAWELRCAEPLLDVRLLRLPGISSAAVAMAMAFFCFYGLFFLGIQYLSYVRGYGSFACAVAFLPVAVWFPLAPQVVRLVQRYGRRTVLTGALACAGLGYLVCGTLGTGSPYVVFALALAVIGAAMVALMLPATMQIVESLPTGKQGVASALNDLVRQLGAAFGVAVVGAVFNEAFRERLSHEALPAGQGPQGALHRLAGGDGMDASTGLVRDAFMSGFRPAMITCAVLLGFSAAFVAVRTPVPSQDPVPGRARETV
jgi:MFS family permease